MGTPAVVRALCSPPLLTGVSVGTARTAACVCGHIATDFSERGLWMDPPPLPDLSGPPAHVRFDPEFVPAVDCFHIEASIWNALTSVAALTETKNALGNPTAPQPMSLFPWGGFRESPDDVARLAAHLAAGPFALTDDKLVVMTIMSLTPNSASFATWKRMAQNWLQHFWQAHGEHVCPLMVCGDDFTFQQVRAMLGPGRESVAFLDHTQWCVVSSPPPPVGHVSHARPRHLNRGRTGTVDHVAIMNLKPLYAYLLLRCGYRPLVADADALFVADVRTLWPVVRPLSPPAPPSGAGADGASGLPPVADILLQSDCSLTTGRIEHTMQTTTAQRMRSPSTHAPGPCTSLPGNPWVSFDALSARGGSLHVGTNVVHLRSDSQSVRSTSVSCAPTTASAPPDSTTTLSASTPTLSTLSAVTGQRTWSRTPSTCCWTSTPAWAACASTGSIHGASTTCRALVAWCTATSSRHSHWNRSGSRSFTSLVSRRSSRCARPDCGCHDQSTNQSEPCVLQECVCWRQCGVSLAAPLLTVRFGERGESLVHAPWHSVRVCSFCSGDHQSACGL